MNKQVHNKVVDQKILDGGTVVEDVTSVDTPKIEFISDEVDIPGASAKLNIVSPNQVNALTMTINHNNGNGCDSLNTPELHKFEMRLAQQVINTAGGTTTYKGRKIRAWGTLMSTSRGSIERGNPLGSSNEYSLQRYEEEVNGTTIIKIDVLAGICEFNGKDYAKDINRLLE